MSNPALTLTDQEPVTLRVGDYELVISVRRVGGTSAGTEEFELVAPSTSPSIAPESFAGELTLAKQDQVLAATSVAQLERLELPFLNLFAERLRPVHGVWTPKARVIRAFRAGIAAHRRLQGVYCEFSSIDIPFRNSVYICLRGGADPEPFWTTSYNTYINRVRGSHSDFHGDSVSHAFPSRTEAEAYLAGSLQPWPQQL